VGHERAVEEPHIMSGLLKGRSYIKSSKWLPVINLGTGGP